MFKGGVGWLVFRGYCWEGYIVVWCGNGGEVWCGMVMWHGGMVVW